MATTLQDLRDGVRIETRDPHGILYQDPDIDYNINQAYRVTFEQIVNALQKNFVVPVPFDIGAFQREYPLPVDCLRLEKIEMLIGTTYIPLRRYTRGYSPNYVGGISFGVRTPIPTYDLEGDNVVLEPTPRVAVVNGLLMTYEAIPIDLISPTDTIVTGFKDLWKDVVILRATRACFSQTEASGGIVSAKEFNDRLQEAETQMMDSIALRTLSPIKKRRKSYFQ